MTRVYTNQLLLRSISGYQSRPVAIAARPVSLLKRGVTLHSEQRGIITGLSRGAYNLIAKILPGISPQKKAKLCLLIAAHNEELVIENTLRSAISAGMNPAYIYVVDDASSDKTNELASAILGQDNVLKVAHSGKGLALTKASKHFELTERYQWIHIADADGGFAEDYFKVFTDSLDEKNAAATGYIKSLPGRIVSQYRVFEYTIGMELHRRFQSIIRTIPVIPGPTSCFRSDVFAKVDFNNGTLTEDFYVTLQIHRQKLGPIQFISEAVAYTQDPANIRDFVKQITRWNRGVLQGVLRHKIGRRAQKVDAYLTAQIFQNLFFFINNIVLLPLLATRYGFGIISLTFLLDVFLTLVLTILVAVRSRRWDILSAFPHIYVLRYVQLAIFIKTFVEVIVLRRFQGNGNKWSTEGRRYKPIVAPYPLSPHLGLEPAAATIVPTATTPQLVPQHS